MKFWRIVEVIGCIVLLMSVELLCLRAPACHAFEEAFLCALESAVQAFLDGKTDTYRGFDSAVIHY